MCKFCLCIKCGNWWTDVQPPTIKIIDNSSVILGRIFNDLFSFLFRDVHVQGFHVVNLVLNALSRARQILGSKYMHIKQQYLQQSESVKCEPCLFSPHKFTKKKQNKSTKNIYYRDSGEEALGETIGLLE